MQTGRQSVQIVDSFYYVFVAFALAIRSDTENTFLQRCCIDVGMATSNATTLRESDQQS